MYDEPAVLRAPSALEMLEDSEWVASCRHLRRSAETLLRALPDRRARAAPPPPAHAPPARHPGGVARIASLAWQAAGTAAGWAARDVAPMTYRAVVEGERPSPRAALLARTEDLVRSAGPMYVKLGQFVATSQGLLPQEIVDRFAWCRDAVPPFPGDVARKVVEEALGEQARELVDFEDEPLSAASIAQVHAARLRDGTPVVVKVRRPGLRRVFEADLRALALVAVAAESRAELARRANTRGFVRLFASLAMEELDFRIEAANMVELGLVSEHAGMDFVRCPRPVPGLVDERVLVMDRLPGVPYDQARDTLEGDVDPEALLRLAIRGVLEHTLVYGVFHGDLHAGNVLVDGDGTYGLVDFGIVGRLDEARRSSLVRFMYGFASGDPGLLVRALQEFGAVPEEADAVALARAFEENNVGQLDAITHDAMFAEIARTIRITVDLGLQLPTELVLFFKNLLYLNGLTAGLAPGSNLIGHILPIFEYFQGRYGEAIDAHLQRGA